MTIETAAAAVQKDVTAVQTTFQKVVAFVKANYKGFIAGVVVGFVAKLIV
jgi:hypothetical protein